MNRKYSEGYQRKHIEYWTKNNPKEQPGLKQCRVCKQKLSRDKFAVGRDRLDGLQPDCNSCRWTRYRKDPRAQMITSARKRAQKKKIPFNLTKEDIVIPNECPVLGIKLGIKTGRGQLPGSPSLDRIDNNQGYTKDNVRVISWRANDLKRDATAEELERIAAYIRKEKHE